MKLSTMLTSTVSHAGDGTPAGTLTDIVIDPETRRPTHYVVDVATDGAVAPVFFDPETIELSAGFVATTASPEAVASKRDEALEKGEGAAPLEDMPPLATGPFGNTISPLMMAALSTGRGQTGSNPPKPPREGTYFFTRLVGLPVFDVGADLGTLQDVVLHPHTQDCIAMHTVTADGVAYDFPFELIRNVAKGGTHIIIQRNDIAPHDPVGNAG